MGEQLEESGTGRYVNRWRTGGEKVVMTGGRLDRWDRWVKVHG